MLAQAFKISGISLATLLFAVSVALLCGKGNWVIADLIASLRTTVEDFDERGFCRLVALGFTVDGGLLLATQFVWNDSPFIQCVIATVVFIDLISTFVFGSKIFKSRLDNAKPKD